MDGFSSFARPGSFGDNRDLTTEFFGSTLGLSCFVYRRRARQLGGGRWFGVEGPFVELAKKEPAALKFQGGLPLQYIALRVMTHIKRTTKEIRFV